VKLNAEMRRISGREFSPLFILPLFHSGFKLPCMLASPTARLSYRTRRKERKLPSFFPLIPLRLRQRIGERDCDVGCEGSKQEGIGSVADPPPFFVLPFID